MPCSSTRTSANACWCEALVKGVIQLTEAPPSSARIAELTDQIVRDEWIRHVHVAPIGLFGVHSADAVGHKPILVSPADRTFARLNLGWRARRAEDGARIEGIDACCAYLARVIDQAWADIQSALKDFDRQALVYRLAINIEAVQREVGAMVPTIASRAVGVR